MTTQGGAASGSQAGASAAPGGAGGSVAAGAAQLDKAHVGAAISKLISTSIGDLVSIAVKAIPIDVRYRLTFTVEMPDGEADRGTGI